jgi:hypothetical protein
MSEEPEEIFPFAVPAPPTAAVDGLNSHDARLIWDLVSNMRPPADVCAAYGVSATDLAAKAQNPLWSGAYREAQKLWKSDMNIQQRIRLKAAFLLEDSLLTLFNIIRQDGIGIQAKLEAVEKLVKISTVANVPKEGAASEKHNITINIGGNAPPIKVVAETPSGTTELTNT